MLKILGLLAVAAAALMAFAGSAAADTATSPVGTTFSGNIVATSTNAALSGTVNITCKHSAIDGDITSQSAGNPVAGHVDNLSFTECNYTVEVRKAGTLSLQVTGTNTATLTSNGVEVTVVTHGLFGTVHCIYTTENTVIGTVTGGTAPTFHATSPSLPQVATDIFCGDHATWSGDYKITSPHELHLDNN